MRTLRLTAVAAVAAALVPAAAEAQLVKITPKVGGYFRSASVEQIRDDAGNAFDFERKEVSTLAIGANLEVEVPGSPVNVRGDLALATDTEARLSDPAGVSSEDLESSLVAASGSLVLRPLSFLPLVDPYLLGGAGFTSANYDATQVQGASDLELPSDRSFALHAGVGTDLELGGLRLQAEATDYVTGIDTDGDLNHDVFITAGLGVPLF